MIVYHCAMCPTVLETGTRSLEKAGALAAKEQWLLYGPRGTVWCPRCAPHRRTVST